MTTASGDLGCLSCLLRTGSEEESVETTISATPASFGAYVIARHEDGSYQELGHGAMGVTFLAEDVSLRRRVALKIIKADFAHGSSDARERFTREARAAAALRHPNVATVYQFGLDDESGQYFCAMELVEGETLEERVRRTGPLDLTTVLAIARQVTAALAAAESCGLVHRDLKPGNIMITAGKEADKVTVKVIDFGVAKALHEAPDARTLTHGGFVGTPAFSSPEQMRGAAVDVRSDIYSLGATLACLLTGKIPSPNRTTGSAALTQQLKSAGVPFALSKLLGSMLAEEPAARPSVETLARELESISGHPSSEKRLVRYLAIAAVLVALAAGSLFFLTRHPPSKLPSDESGGVQKKGIAVLPLKDLSSEKDGAFFAEGLQDEIQTNLARVADLKVISRNSVSQYGSSAKRNLPQIARELGVTYALEGEVQRTGDDLRVSVELIDARNDAHLWSHSYDRKVADLFAIQSEIARTIADQLQTKLSPGVGAAIDRPPTNSMAAYALYLNARKLLQDPSMVANAAGNGMKGEELLKAAIQLDPNFVLAYCELAGIYDDRYWNEVDHTPECRARADAAIETATRLAPDLGEVHLARANHFYHGYRQYAWARAEFALAKAKLPNEPRVYSSIGYLDRREGHWDDAVKNLRHAFELNPANMDLRFELADLYESLGWFSQVRQLLEDVPANGVLGDNKTDILSDIDFLEKGDMSRRMSITPAKQPDGAIPFWNLKNAVYARDGKRSAKILAELPSDYFGEPYTLLYWKGAAAQVAGDRTAMLQAYGDARAAAAKASVAASEDAELWGALGLYDAILGNKDEALKEGRRAIELLPIEQDSVRGMELAVNLVYIYGWIGEKDQAFAELRRLMKIPRGPRYGHLRYYPQYDPLREDPRFQKILASVTPDSKSGALLQQ